MPRWWTAPTGADAFFWLAPRDPQKTLEEVYLDFTRPAAEALRSHVVAVTALGRGTEWEGKAGLVTASIRMDDMLMTSGVAFRGLAMPSFMDNVPRQTASIKEKGMFFGPIDPDKKAKHGPRLGFAGIWPDRTYALYSRLAARQRSAATRDRRP